MLPIQIIEIELSQPLPSLTDLAPYSTLRGLVRLHGRPIGEIQLTAHQGKCSSRTLAEAILSNYSSAIARELVRLRLAQSASQSCQIADFLDLPPVLPTALPSVTVAVCCLQPPDLACLAALQAMIGVDLDLLLIEANPQTSDLKTWVSQQPAQFRYLATTETGLNAIRNLAIGNATGEIIAFTDAQSQVDSHWVQAIAIAFSQHSSVMGIAGLTLPTQIETEAQAQFEAGYSLGRGCEQQWYRFNPTQPLAWTALGMMSIGTGINMAFRRSLFDQIGGFDAALDRLGGGDWDLFCRLLLAGETLLYEPSAIVRYTPPRQAADLQTQVAQSSAAFFAYLIAGMQRHPTQRLNFIRLGLWKLAKLCDLRSSHSRSLIRSELSGLWSGLWHWRHATAPLNDCLSPRAAQPRSLNPKLQAVESVDVSQPLTDLTAVSDYHATRVFVQAGAVPVGLVDLHQCFQPISAAHLRQTIADHLYLELLALPYIAEKNRALARLEATLADRWLPAASPSLPTLPTTIPVSIIITTCDRPHDLTQCLRHLQAQKTARPLEIIVADNRPASGLTPRVVAQFPGVKLVSESRPGGSYGRNAAFAASSGDIIVSVDDDVIVPPDWLEKLIAPMIRPEVMVITGNVLPLELETEAQVMFETVRGGLGQGFRPFEVDRGWWESFQQSPPTWTLGVSANAAFRATIFSHPQIGLMDEVLGPGKYMGGGEENHLVYKVLRAGYTLVYEPAAFVWHKHRRDMPALYRQVCGHMKGGTAYHLVLWLQEKDIRGFRLLAYELPYHYLCHTIARLRGQHHTPWRLLWSEIAGYLTGYWSYWQSQQSVCQQGRSAPYVPVVERSTTQQSIAEPDR